LEEEGVDWMVMLRSFLKNWNVRMWTGSVWPRIGTTGSGAHPASYTMSTRSLPGVKRPGRGVDKPPPSRAEVKEGVDLYLALWAFMVCSRMNFTFTFSIGTTGRLL